MYCVDMIAYKKHSPSYHVQLNNLKNLKLNAFFYLISQYSVSISVAVPAAVGLLSFFFASACGFCGGPLASARKDGVPGSELYLPPAV
jgi:hypothetical protein